MKRIKQWKIYLTVVLSVALACCLLAACSGWKITLNKNELTLKAGESETLIAECDAEGAELSWSSDNAAVATVSGEGEVVAVAAGTCTVTVTAVKGGDEKTATCAVTVSPAPTAAYKVETYVQKDDLSFEKEGETEKSAAIGATVTESPAAREGLIVDKENSVLSATVSADGTTTLKIYYALPYKNLYLVRVDNVASFYRVYEEKGLIVNEQGAEANISEEFAPTADEDGKYYFWNVGGVTSKGTFTKEELLGMKDEALIREGVSSDAVFNTAKPNANFTANDGCFQTEATTKWGESASYLYYTGSSDTFYAKVQVDNLKESGDMDISAGFTLADARNHSKNVQFYFSGSSKGGWLAQNNSYHWEDNDSTRWVVENAAEVPTDAQSNVFEIIVFNGNVAIYSNEKLMFVLPVEELTGAGNEPGVLAETTVFDLGIAQWRFNHTAKFDSKEFACGDAAKTLIEARLPKLSLNKTSLTVFEGDEAESLTASWNSPLVKLDADKIVWDSSNKAVATVENGTVTFIAAGETEITATYQFLGVTLSAKCTVTVQEPANVTLALSETEITAANEKAAAVTLTASWDAEDETLDASAIVWESGDETVATVAGGVVTFTGIGSTTITARCTYKGRPVRATCSVTVTGTYLFKEDSKNATFNDNGSIDMTNGGGWNPNYTYAKGSGTAFWAETTISATAGKDNDISAGITVKGKDGDSFQLYLANKTIKVNFLHRWAETATETTTKTLLTFTEAYEISDTSSVKMGLAYLDGTFYLYLNNELVHFFTTDALTYVYNSENKQIEIGDNGWTIGLASWHTHKPRFTDSYVTFDAAEATKKVEAHLPELLLSKTSVTVIEGAETQTLTLGWSLTACNIDDSAIVWESSDNAVATVENGKVTFIAAGETEITATYQFLGVTLSAKCTVTVQEPANVTLALSETEITAANEKAAAVTLTASWDAEDETLDASAIVWESGDETVATVAGGVVTFTGIGSTTITARCTYKGRPVRATCSVTVTGTYLFKEDSKNATFNDNGSIDMTNGGGWNPNYTYAKGSGTAFWAETTISATAGKDNDISAGITVKGKDGDSFQLYLANKTIKVNFLHRWAETATETTTKTLLTFTEAYEISDTSSVKMGLAYLDGTFYLYLNNELVHFFTTDALTYVYNSENKQIEIGDNGWTIGLASWHTHKPRFTDSYVTFDAAEATKKVEAHLPELLLSKTSVTVIEGAETQTLTLGWSLTACNIDDSAIVWESSDNAVATVENGTVTFIAAGETEITATYQFLGVTLSAKCTVTVQEPANVTLALSETEITAANEKAAAVTLTASWDAEDETLDASAIVWESGDETVATVAGGVVTFTGIGSTTITARCTYKGRPVRATCSVTVTGTYLFKEDSKNATFNDNGSIDMTNGGGWNPNYTYAKGSGTAFWAETTISATAGKDNDISAGITVKGKDGDSFQLYLANKTIKVNFLHRWAETATETTTKTLLTFTEAYEISDTSSVKMGLAYLDGTFYLYLNNELVHFFTTDALTYVYNSENKQIEIGDNGWTIGLASWHTHKPRFTDSYVTFDAAEATKKSRRICPSLLLSKTSVTVIEGAETQTLTLGWSLTACNIDDSAIVWESSDNAVATVENGTVTFIAAGETEITATYQFLGVTLSAKCTVTVQEPANVTLALSETEITAANEKAAAVTLTASWDAEDETLDTSAIVWESGDETVATVAGGVVTFTGIGSTTITARCTYKGRPVRATCSVTVTGTYLFKEDSKNATFNDNGSIDMTNGGGWNPNYTYAKGSGTAFWAETTISATAGKDNDISAGITVKGKDGDSFQLYLANKTIKVNFLHRWAETATETTTKTLLTFTEAYEISDTSSVKMGLAYLDGTFYLYLNNELVHFFTTDALTYVYNSENKQIEIGDNGWTIGLASWHTHKPRFTDSYVTFDAAEATKKVEAHLPELLLSKTSVTVIEGAETQTLTLGWSLTACNIDDSAIVWESSDNAVATVENGKVTFVGVGNATITAKYVFFGETLTAECEVTVEKKPNVELSLNKSEISAANEKAAPEKLTLSWNYAEGQTGPELGDINPASITWSSSDETVATVAGGVVTFKGLGTATINVSYPYEGGTLRTSCSVTVTGTYLFNGELSSKATDNGDGTIDFKTGDGDGGRYAYAKGQGNTFYVSTEITSLNGTQKDVSAGFTIKGKDGDSVQIYLYSDNQWIAINFLYTWGGTNYTWLPEALNKKIEVSNEKAAKMGLAYRGGVFYLFIQDELAYTFSENILTYTKGSEKKTLEPAEDGWSVGIACFEAKGKMRQLRFTNSYVTFCANEVQQKLDELAPKLALDQTTVSAAAGAEAQTLTATLKLTDGVTNNTVYPSREVKVQWESSDGAVVTVSNGTLTFAGVGTATVTAKYTLPGYGEITATCEVTVTEPVS